MPRSPLTQQERTRKYAVAFLEECRRDLEQAIAKDADLPPRLRSVHTRPGHATPEYRTLAIPIPAAAGDVSPEVLSGIIARYAAQKAPVCLMLSLDAVSRSEGGEERRVLITEARDRSGTRLFLVQPFRVEGKRTTWDEPLGCGWRDPGEQEMVLDAAFACAHGVATPAPV